jgi:hypothetical protein
LGFVGNGDVDTFFTDFFVPALDADEPVIRRGIGRAAEKGDYQEVVNGLRGREIGVEPELIAWKEVGDCGDGQQRA